MTELTKKEETSLVIPKEFAGFTDEEALGGMAPISEGYMKSYRYFLSRPTLKDKFQIVDNETDQVVWEGSRIDKAIIYYGHEVMRLKSGYITSPDKKENDFDEEEKKILAVTYDPKKSKGNFEANGHGKYLTNEFKDLHGNMTRLYLIMIIPGLKDITNLEPIAASFSVTTVSSFKDLVKKKDGYRIPLPYVYSDIFFKEDKSKNGTTYDRITFDFPLKDGFPVPVHKSREAYLASERGLKLLNQIIETHKAAVSNSESGSFGGFVEKEASSGEAYNVEEDIKNTFKGTVVSDANVADDDDVPF